MIYVANIYILLSKKDLWHDFLDLKSIWKWIFHLMHILSEDLWFTLKLLSFSEIVQIVHNAKRSVIIQNNQTSIYSPFYLNGFAHKEKFLGSFNIH